MHIHTSDNANKDAGKRISTLLLEHADVPVLLMLSGGSAFSVLEYIDLNAIDSRVSISLIDERLGVADADSNAWQLAQTEWFQEAKGRSAQLVQLEQGAIKEWRASNKEGKVIALLGMGPDGHTAGILPMPENEELFNNLFIQTDNWVTEYKVNAESREGALGHVHHSTDNPFKERITVTGVFLSTVVDNIVLYTTGESKCKRLQELVQGYAPHIEPADILLKLKTVEVFTDCKEGLSNNNNNNNLS